MAMSIDPANHLPPAMFRRQMQFLSRHRRVVSVSSLLDQLARGVTPGADTVCITFDDGYLDTLTVAAPILNEFVLPATIYLATGYITRAENQWADVLHWVIRNRSANDLHLTLGEVERFNLASNKGLSLAKRALHEALLEMSLENRAKLLRDVHFQLRPVGRMPRLTLTWDEVRELRRRYPLVEFGGHTRDHIDLSTYRGETAKRQLEECARDLERELSVRPVHFSFPYGHWCSETRQIVRALGWRSAMGDGDNRRIGTWSDLFVLPRIDTPRTMSELRFKTLGAYPEILERIRIRR
jgi:peptidoglycan/xylan/chitin deacetylase (PgdA/CDA1 family)